MNHAKFMQTKIGKMKIISWFSGGVTSAVTCKLCVEIYGIESCRFVFMDTKNEHESTEKFIDDCSEWLGKPIERITALGDKYKTIQDVWIKNKSLNIAKGAICSATLKTKLRLKWQRRNEYDHQAFGFDISEINRAKSMVKSHEEAKPIFPLLMFGMSKKDCLKYLSDAGVQVPEPYANGFGNNNCFKTGCIQGGIGYWQKMKREHPDKFEKMAEMEHRLTDIKGEPVTMLKDQSNEAKLKKCNLVFLKKHPDYPSVLTIDDKKGREPKPLMDCMGFCGINDLDKPKTAEELNFQGNLFK